MLPLVINFKKKKKKNFTSEDFPRSMNHKHKPCRNTKKNKEYYCANQGGYDSPVQPTPYQHRSAVFIT